MVNFFIGRPIFATVLALLMLLVGGICIFVLPIAQYPEITPPQVQVTTTFTGADAQTVSETVTKPIEQQINGVKGMIYFNSDSTSNGISTVVSTFDVGYSQDIGAVDIQNRVQTAQAVLPPEVKQFGVTIKKTSTDMVCVVNLVSPDGRYDSTFLDNYAQIYALDVLRRIPGVSDVTAFGRKYAMRIWLDPDRLAGQLIPPTEVIEAIQSENRQAAAGRIGSQPVPQGQALREYPILVKGRLTTVKEFEEIIVRRRPDGSIVRLGEVARIELDSENYDTAGWLSGKPAGTLPIYQYSDANALDIVRQVRENMDRLAKSFPPGLKYRIAYDTTKYVSENIREVEETLLEAFLLVLLVVFVFLQGVRATIIPMMAIPVALVATFAMMAAFGFSINTLTLCGLILAIGLVVDDAIIVVENVEKYLGRGEQPIPAVRAAMAEITAPILTITLVLGAVFVPVAFIPGLTGRLYNQFAMTIVFSFVFSAVNSLTFSPAMAGVFLRAKHGESRFFLFRWFNAGMRWLENSYDSFLDFTAHHWWTIVVPSIALLAITYYMLLERPKAFIPGRGSGLPDHRDPDSRRNRPRGDFQGREHDQQDRPRPRGSQRRGAARGFQRPELHQPDQLGHGVRAPQGMERAHQDRAARPGLDREAPGRDLQRDSRRRRGCAPTSTDPRPEPDRRLRVHDRGPRRQGRRRPGPDHRSVSRGGEKTARARRPLHAVYRERAPDPLQPRSHQGPAAGCRGFGRVRCSPDQPGRLLRQ